jgi:CRISPR system Cascade subunit CasD
MSVLLLRLAGAMQSWGDSSRFTRRLTRREPTKSGVLGLIAAAQGRRRADPVEDLVAMRFGVRVDQPGELQRDFQTARHPVTGRSFPLSYRYYLADAIFLAGVEADRALLEGIADAIRSPEFPLYLGRRGFPPGAPIVHNIVDSTLTEALAAADWIASERHRRSVHSARVELDIWRDETPTDRGRELETQSVCDVPMSFDQERREYGWRTVVRDHTEVPNLNFDPEHDADTEPDFFAAIGGA